MCRKSVIGMSSVILIDDNTRPCHLKTSLQSSPMHWSRRAHDTYLLIMTFKLSYIISSLPGCGLIVKAAFIRRVCVLDSSFFAFKRAHGQNLRNSEVLASISEIIQFIFQASKLSEKLSCQLVRPMRLNFSTMKLADRTK